MSSMPATPLIDMRCVDYSYSVPRKEKGEVQLVTALREDHLRELLRDVDVGLLERGPDQAAPPARTGDAHVGQTGRRALADLHRALRAPAPLKPA